MIYYWEARWWDGMGREKICENFRNIYRNEWGEFISIQPQRLSVFPSINYSIQTLWRVKSNRNVVQIRKILETPPHHPTKDLWHHNSSQSSAAKQKGEKSTGSERSLLADLCDHRNHLINFQECCSVARSRHHRVACACPPAAKQVEKWAKVDCRMIFRRLRDEKVVFYFPLLHALPPLLCACLNDVLQHTEIFRSHDMLQTNIRSTEHGERRVELLPEGIKLFVFMHFL